MRLSGIVARGTSHCRTTFAGIPACHRPSFPPRCTLLPSTRGGVHAVHVSLINKARLYCVSCVTRRIGSLENQSITRSSARKQPHIAWFSARLSTNCCPTAFVRRNEYAPSSQYSSSQYTYSEYERRSSHSSRVSN